ncbi:hypothetical protein DLAC_08819 [Tieghemostelium lacteum]|uniref:Uncharacterized protein n=1 Tax=Tieghemostelium lacteum TaxID=361077 RepID=A0A151Z8G1_TIELA|nr:hypothetical protein DLAC_08819 [Tieghemostelium lacteum]|eukprot:KYQ90218.1 hypothetical protein DLAC_08819 [Tieghemostelium lacteum]
MLTRSLIVYIVNLWVGYGKKSITIFKYTVNILAKLRLISKEFTVNIIPLLDWGEIRIQSKNDMKILNKLFNPKPKLDRLYISCLEEEIIQPEVGISYPIVAHQLINKNRLKSLHWDYHTNHNIADLNCNNLIELEYTGSNDIYVDLSVISISFLNLVELTIHNFGVIMNMNSLGQLEHLKMITLISGTSIIGSFIELLKRKQCSVETIEFLYIKFKRSIDQDANLVEHFENILDVLSSNSFLKKLLIKNDVSPVSKQSLIQFLNRNKTLTNLTIENCRIIVDANIIYQPITNTTLKYFDYHMFPIDNLGQILLNDWIGPSALVNPYYSETNNIPLISKGNHPNINVYYYDGSKDNLNNLIDILKPVYKGIDNITLRIEDNDMVEEVIETMKKYLPSNNEISVINLINGLEIAKYLIKLNHPSIKELTFDSVNSIDQDIAINILKSFCSNNNHIQNITPIFELNSLNLAEFVDTITEIIENNHNICCIELILSIPDSIINTTNLNLSYERFEKAISKFYHYLDLINITILQGPIGNELLLKPFYNILCKYSILNKSIRW